MNIRYFQNTDITAWDSYVMEHPEGTIFHLSKWKKVVDQAFGHPSYYLLAEEEEEIRGILPLFQIKSLLFGNFLVSVPFAELGGPLCDNAEVEDGLLKRAASIAEELACDYVELKSKKPTPGLLTKDLYFNFSREIYSEVDDNMLAIPRKSRAAVRKGIKEGLKAEFGDHLFDEFYEIMAHSYHHLGTPIFPKAFFRAFLDIFETDAEVMVVRSKEGALVAGVMTFYFKDRVMPYYAGSIWEHRRLCPNDFKYWELMKRGCERGFKVFDYGRSKVDTGSFSFKKHWGFEAEPLAYQYQLIRSKELPNLSPANPKYKRKIEMWQKIPLGLTKIIGPPLAKFLA